MDPKQESRRLSISLGLFFAVILVFSGKLIELQVVHGADYVEQAQRKIAHIETVEAARGEIYDRNGLPLVTNQVRYQLSLDLSQMKHERDETLLTLMELCQASNLRWTDTLPISHSAPYIYTGSGESTVSQRRFEEYLAKENIRQPEQAQHLIDRLARDFSLPEALSPQTRRALVGILYECALRQKEITWQPYVFVSDADNYFLTKLKELGLPGVTINPLASRRYETQAAAHILGRVGPMNETEWAQYQALGYDMDAIIGKDGAEQAFEAYLHPERGSRTIESDTRGTVIGAAYTADPKPGSHVLLTLDRGLQERTEALLAEKVPQLGEAEGAAVAILDVRDGGVLTLASYPSFQLDSFSADYPILQEDPLRPLYNRALQGTYAPGSTYKMVTAVAALEEGLITPETKILDTGKYTYYRDPQPRCWIYRQTGKTHGMETVSEAITDSCNIFFYDTGRRLGIERLEDYARQFGLGETCGIELAGEALGAVASPSYTKSLGQTWYEGNTLSAAIGQENNRFTPLQLAGYVATLANGGQRLQVHLLEEIKSFDFQDTLLRQEKKVLGDITIQKEHLAAVKEGMLAVTESGSVAPYFRNVPVQVGAKTGSAQVTGNEEANAVFVCFAPYENPEVAIAIVVEKGGSGSELGAIAAGILEYYFSPEPEETEPPAPEQGETEPEEAGPPLQNDENSP